MGSEPAGMMGPRVLMGHQARLLCNQLSVPDNLVAAIWQVESTFSTGEELHAIYQLIIAALQKR